MKQYIIGLCLLLANGVFSQNALMIRKPTAEEVAASRESYKNPESVKKTLMRRFAGDHLIEPEFLPEFKEMYDIADNILRVALMDICQSVWHVGKDPFQRGEPLELTEDKRRLRRSLECFRHCADKPVKEFLMKAATDGALDNTYRSTAISSYLHCADAEEVRVGLAPLLADKSQNLRLIYMFSMDAYDDAGDDAQKREALMSTASAALLKEEDKKIFAEADGRLSGRSKEYAASPQRKAALQRFDLPLPPEPEEEKKPFWKFW